MRYLITIIIVVTACVNVLACDICGCQLGGYTFGILSQNPTHFIGVRYSQAQFYAHINNETLADEYSHDTYRTMELMGRYVISKKWQLSAIIPYSYNNMDGNSQKTSVSGIGDPMLMGYYSMVNTTSENFRDWNHSLMLGAGLKFPLGEYDAEENEEIINRNFQLGSGSLDYVFSGIYTLKYKSIGLNVESSYKINTENNLQYRFGNQWTNNAKIYYAVIQPSFSLIPYVGLTYETSKMHQDEGFKQVNTGGSAVLTNFGLQALYGQLMLMANYAVIASQDYNTDARSTIQSKNRFQIGLVLNIASKSSQEIEL